jgi:diaminopimelate epimerase
MPETEKIQNVNLDVIEHFGKEWRLFDQSTLFYENLIVEFDKYFSIFPWESLPEDSVGFDAGCGSGRCASSYSGYSERFD